MLEQSDPPARDAPGIPGTASVRELEGEPSSLVGEYVAGGSWLAGGRRDPDRFDEMVDETNRVRDTWADLAAGLSNIGRRGIQRMRSQVERMLDDDGVTYNPVDEVRPEPAFSPPAQRDSDARTQMVGFEPAVAAASRERWKLDPVPLVLGESDWAFLEAAVRQRAVLLDLVLTDLYGPRKLLRRGLIPADLIFSSRAYLRAAHGLTIPGPHQLFLYGADVFRSPSGEFQAMGDRAEAPSGTGYAMADRRVVSRVSPDLFRKIAPSPISGFFKSFLLSLQAVAPRAADDPRVVVLSPGIHSETAFDQAYVASLLNLPLVESADLTVRQGRVWMRALGRYEPVDVILRRVDSEYSDPLDMRPDSQLGVIGLRQACRRGSVTVVNPLGSGILENPGLLPLLPNLAQTLLGEDLKLPSVETFWCGQPTVLSHVRAHFGEMVMRPTDGSQRSVIVARLDNAQAAELMDKVAAQPNRWVAQPYAPFSVAPVGTADGLVAGQVGMRLFALAQQSGYLVMPGGLGRVLPLDQKTRRTSGFTEAKDVWISTGTVAVEAGDRDVTPWVHEHPLTAGRSSATSSPRALEDLYWFGRYTERVEDFSRLLIATWDRVEESRQTGISRGGLTAILLATVTHTSATYPGFVGGYTGSPSWQTGWQADVLPEMRSLLLDGYRLGSIAQALNGLKEAASGIRDQLSRDTWLVLAGVDRAMNALAKDKQDQGTTLQASYASVLSGMLALGGLAVENMVRDPGWYLMDIGRRLERSLQLVNVLRWALARVSPPEIDAQLIESVLQFAESILTYKRRYRGRTQIGTVLELLLLDPDNPRSLAYQLQSMVADFRALPDSSGTSVPERMLDDLVAKVRRTAVIDLGKADAQGVREDLVDYLKTLHASLTALAEAVAMQRFRHPLPIQQLDEYGSKVPAEQRSA
jgi:uncharacterized circularly permuted ATP-grasp superfamily protein/uncharacterized alpha-E superfamily protein